MSLDNIQDIRISSSPNLFTHVWYPASLFTSAHDPVTITANPTGSVVSEDGLYLVKGGAKGWDMPSVRHTSRLTAEGHGEITSAYKVRGRKFSFRASERISGTTQNTNMQKLMKHLDPFTRTIVQVRYSGSTHVRYLVGCQYLGGLDRADRRSDGRQQFDVNLFSPWGYFVSPFFPTSRTFTPSGEGKCIWGVQFSPSANISSLNINISTSGTTTDWQWRWSPVSGISPPTTTLGSSAPRNLYAIFSNPFHGVWGDRTNSINPATLALSDKHDVSLGRVYGAPLPPYLTSGDSVEITGSSSPSALNSLNVFCLKNYSRIGIASGE